MATLGSGKTSGGGINRFHDPKGILARNIFDSSQGDLTLEPSTDVFVSDDASYDPNQPPPICSGSTRLVGALFSPNTPEWSFASISNSSGAALLYREGMDMDSGRVLAINSYSVVMQPTDGSRCMLTMFDQNAPARPKRTAKASNNTDATAKKRDRDRNGGLTDEELDEGIQKISDTKVIVKRELVEKVLSDQASLMRTARVIPHQENGQTVGVKLYGIRRNSLLGRLGLKNGDMLRTINGFDLSDPASALEAFATLRTKDNLSIALKDRTINIGIQ